MGRMRTATCTRDESSQDGVVGALRMVVVVTWGVLGVVATFDVEEEKEEDSLMEALVGVMRCGEDLGVPDRDRCPFILGV